MGILAKTLKISLGELVDNNLEIECKEHSAINIFNNLINKNCYLTFSDDFFDFFINCSTLVKVLDANGDFIKLEYLKNKKKAIKLIDMDLIVAIRVVESEEK